MNGCRLIRVTECYSSDGIGAPEDHRSELCFKSDEDGSLKGKRNKAHKWSLDEDKLLLDAVFMYGIDKWTAVAKFVGNKRTKSQCSQRWNRVISPSISRENWKKEEDELLMKLVEELGEKSWKRISQQMGSRSDTQCRYRFKQLSCNKEKPIPIESHEKSILPSIWNLIDKN